MPVTFDLPSSLTVNGSITASSFAYVSGTGDATAADGLSGSLRALGGLSVVKSGKFGGTISSGNTSGMASFDWLGSATNASRFAVSEGPVYAVEVYNDGVVGNGSAAASFVSASTHVASSLTGAELYGVSLSTDVGTTSQVNGATAFAYNQGLATVTHLAGIYVGATSSGTTDSAYGVRISNITGASNNYSISTGTGVARFGDTTDATDATGLTGSVGTFGGLSVAKKGYFGTGLTVTGTSQNLTGVATINATTDPAGYSGYGLHVLQTDTSSSTSANGSFGVYAETTINRSLATGGPRAGAAISGTLNVNGRVGTSATTFWGVSGVLNPGMTSGGGGTLQFYAVRGIALAQSTLSIPISKLYGGTFGAGAFPVSSGGWVTNIGGIEVGTISGTYATNAYGIKVGDVSGASTLNYAIYTGTGKVRFGDTSQPTPYTYDGESGALGVKGGANFAGRIGAVGFETERYVSDNSYDGFPYLFYGYLDYTQSGATISTGTLGALDYGVYYTNNSISTSGPSRLYGSLSYASYRGTSSGAANTIHAGEFSATALAPYTTLRGIYAEFGTGNTTVTHNATDTVGIYLYGSLPGTTITTTNIVGTDIAFDTSTLSRATNAYGIRISNISGAANNYAISTGDGLVRLGDTTDATNGAGTTGAIGTLGGLSVAKSIRNEGKIATSYAVTSGTSNYAWDLAATIASNVSTTNLYGVRSQITSNSTSSLSQLEAGYFVATANGASGNVTTLLGVLGAASFSGTGTGTISNAYAMYAMIYPVGSPSTTVTNAYGTYIAAVSSNKITNSYGLYIGNVTNATALNYAIYTGSGVVRFGDATDATDATGTTGSLGTLGGLSVVKKSYFGSLVSASRTLAQADYATDYGIYNATTLTGGIGSTGNGLYSSLNATSTNSTASFTGASVSAKLNGTVASTAVVGLDARASFALTSATTGTALCAGLFTIDAGAHFSATGTIGTTYGISVNMTRGLSSFVTVTNAYGLVISPYTGTLPTNSYGIYLNTCAGGTLSYAIYTNGGLVRFGDDVSTTGSLSVGTVAEYADNAAAVTAGLPVGRLYRTGDILKVVHA